MSVSHLQTVSSLLEKSVSLGESMGESEDDPYLDFYLLVSVVNQSLATLCFSYSDHQKYSFPTLTLSNLNLNLNININENNENILTRGFLSDAVHKKRAHQDILSHNKIPNSNVRTLNPFIPILLILNDRGYSTTVDTNRLSSLFVLFLAESTYNKITQKGVNTYVK